MTPVCFIRPRQLIFWCYQNLSRISELVGLSRIESRVFDETFFFALLQIAPFLLLFVDPSGFGPLYLFAYLLFLRLARLFGMFRPDDMHAMCLSLPHRRHTGRSPTRKGWLQAKK